MKMFKTLIVMVSMASAAFAQQAEGPRELKVLTSQYERAVEKAVEPITAKYLTALKRLKAKLAKEQKLEEALAVEDRINDLVNDANFRFNSLAEVYGKTFSWRRNGKDFGYRLILQRDGSGTMRSLPIKWEKTGNRVIRVSFDDGESADLKYNLRYTEFSGKETRHGGGIIFGKLVK